MRYYTVPRIGSGTDADPYRADVPAGVSWVGCESGTEYLIATPADLGADTASRKRRLPEAALRAAAEAKGLRFEDVLTWRVG